MATQEAMFGAGCFWQVEVDFANLDGVTSTAVGYSGGTVPNPTYEQVCSSRTGHAEVVHVTFDPDRVSYDALLDLFWSSHDPTQKNRQGWDVGPQYRTAVFTYSDEQAAAAAASRDRVQARFRQPIATEITPASEFYAAEDYHQRYLEKRGMASCRVPAGPVR
jgi:peptide-methionine (S)-S-oxide reductase